MSDLSNDLEFQKLLFRHLKSWKHCFQFWSITMFSTTIKKYLLSERMKILNIEMIFTEVQSMTIKTCHPILFNKRTVTRGILSTLHIQLPFFYMDNIYILKIVPTIIFYSKFNTRFWHAIWVLQIKAAWKNWQFMNFIR